MNKILTFIGVFLFAVHFGYSQNCPDPVADTIQYVCTGGNETLADLDVTAGGTLNWYDDAAGTNNIPSSTPVADGETYYVTNTDTGCSESATVPITVYEQSVEFDVDVASCVDLGSNIFFIEDSDLSDPVDIKIKNTSGDPFDAEIKYAPTTDLDYYFPGFGFNPFPSNSDPDPNTNNSGTLGPNNPVNRVEYNLDTLEVHTINMGIPVGDGCPPSNESITLIGGGILYKDFCFGDTKELSDVYDKFEDLFNNQSVDWYDQKSGGNLLSPSDVVDAGEFYYADLGTPNCDVRIPVKIEYGVEAPTFGSEYRFCSADAWGKINVNDVETLEDIPLCGNNLTWYDSSHNVINNPGGKDLVDGETYYVTDTDNGCESEPLKIEATEVDCGCMVDTDINDSNLEGWSFYTLPYTLDACSIDNNNFSAAVPITQGTTNGMGSNADDAVRVTSGFDHDLQTLGIDLPRTSPFGRSCSTNAMRLNTDRNGTADIVLARKEFVGGSLLSFDFAAFLENPPSHTHDDQPFFQVNIYDDQGTLVQSRCIVSDPDDCIFHYLGDVYIDNVRYDQLLYSEWSSVMLDTRQIRGEKATVEFVAAWCSQSAHSGYVYIDNLFVGETDDVLGGQQSFGYLSIGTVDDGDPLYRDCSLLDVNTDNGPCEAVLPALNPIFPIEVCGDIDAPVVDPGSACQPPVLQYLKLNILKDGVNVGTINSANTSGTGFCFEIDSSDVTGGLYGTFTLSAEAEYLMNEGPNEYDYDVGAQNSGFKICPVAECVGEDLKLCVPAGGSLSGIFDLTAKRDTILGLYADKSIFKVSYYDNSNDAWNHTNAIPNPSAYPVTGIGLHTIYARVDYDWDELGMDPEDNCFDIVPFGVIVSQDPELPTNQIKITQCGNPFDLEDQDLRDSILENVSDVESNYTIDFYHSQNGADNADSSDLISDPDDYDVTSSPEKVWVRVQSIGDCYTVFYIELELLPAPTLKDTDITVSACDDGTGNQTGEFDLQNDVIPLLVSTSAGYDVDFYHTQQDADNGQNAIGSLTNYTGGDQEVLYVRIQDGSGGCSVMTTVTLEIVDSPTVPTLDPVELCDEGNQEADFDLADLIPTIQDGDSSLDVDFYGSQNDADAESNALPSTYKSGSKTIYVRVGKSGLDCATIVPLDLQVNPLPELPNSPIKVIACENDDGSDNEFDLQDSNLISDILSNTTGNTSDYEVDFYSTKQGAVSDDASVQIDATVPYEIAQTTDVWVRVENIETGCFDVLSVELVINPLPSINEPVELRICANIQNDGTADFNLNDATTFMIGQNPDYSVYYFETESEAENGASQDRLPTSYTNTTPDHQVIYARIVDNATGCYIVEPVDLYVEETPKANTPDPLVYCDANNDNKGSFYLPDVVPEITTDPDATVSFHMTESDAENDFAPLPDTVYNNQQWTNQTIYVRVSIPGVDCYTIVELELIVAPTPDLVTPTEPLSGCDEDGDGYYTFDLMDEVESVVLVNLSDLSKYDIAYYADQTAIDNDNPIASPAAYESQSGSVFVVVTDKDTGCSSKVELELIVSPVPEAYSAHLELCDENDPGDEVESFNLHDADTIITGGDASLKVSYYESQNDADTAVDSLTSPYENKTNNQTIFVRVENEFGCVTTENISLTLIVNPLPTIDEFDTYKICDIDNDGFADFDLEDFTDSIQEDQPYVDVTYHLTKVGAETGSQTINSTGDFQNSKPDEQRIWIRAVDTNTGCINIGPLDLIVVPSPEIGDLEDLYLCDDDQTGFATFDLTLNNDNIIGGQSPSDLKISYYESQQDAEQGVHPIAVPTSYTNISNPQKIYVRLEDEETGCYDTFDYKDDNSFMLFVEETPDLADAHLSVCDDDYDKDPYPQAVFDLSDAFEDITGGTKLKTGQEINYYANEQDMLDDKPIQNPYFYVNAENPQDIYVVVSNTNTINECSSQALLTIEVLPLPSPSETDPDKLRLSLCDDDNDGVAKDPFDLTISGSIIAGGENVDISYYKSEDAAELGDTNDEDYIDDPENYVNEPEFNETTVDGHFTNIQIVYARVESGSTDNDCYVIVPIELEVIPQPELNPLGDPFGYTLCEDGNTGEAELPVDDIVENLYGYDNGDPNDIIPLLDEDPSTNMGQSIDLEDYEISFYTSQPDAESGSNPIQPGYIASDGDIIYVRVENIESGCVGVIAEIVITVESRPDISSVTITVDLACSEEEGGLYAYFDLTEYNDTINPGSPDDTEVVYYADLDDYNNDHPIETPDHAALQDGQIVIAEVIDTATLCSSVDYAKIKIRVIQRPLVDLSPWQDAVICKDLDPVTTPSDGMGESSLVLDTGFPETGYTFVWYLDGDVIEGADGPTYEVEEEGTYTVLVTNTASGMSCEGSDSVTIYEHNPPEFTATPLHPTISDETGVLVTHISGNGNYEFKIDDGPWIPADDDGTVRFENVGGGEHFVHGRDVDGCGETVIPVNIIDYPDFFTPNNDGHNDTWNIEGLSDQPDARIYIFDRYGKLIKQISPDGLGWDGTIDGRNMPSNDYWFKVEYKVYSLDDSNSHPATFKGHFTLKR